MVKRAISKEDLNSLDIPPVFTILDPDIILIVISIKWYCCNWYCWFYDIFEITFEDTYAKHNYYKFSKNIYNETEIHVSIKN